MVLEQLEIHMQKKSESGHRPYTFHKINLNQRPKCKTQTFKEDT